VITEALIPLRQYQASMEFYFSWPREFAVGRMVIRSPFALTPLPAQPTGWRACIYRGMPRRNTPPASLRGFAEAAARQSGSKVMNDGADEEQGEGYLKPS